jgi:alkylated DNA nucleotide flippase Atl1
VTARIAQLYRKPARGQSAVALGAGEAMRCEAGVGIVGDAHASRLSPRQVLVTLDSELQALGIAPGALGENMVIAGAQPALFRPGSALVGGTGVEIRLTMFCEACKRIAHVAPDLGKLLHRRGVLGVVAVGGTLRVGDTLALIGGRYPALPESPYQKFLDFVATIPAGRVVRYVDVALAIGVDDSFVRALPGYIRRSAGGDLPLHRIVNARGELPRIAPEQVARLQAEGVMLRGAPALARAPAPSPAPAVADLPRYLWRGEPV